jgi:hypothetical protein
VQHRKQRGRKPNWDIRQTQLDALDLVSNGSPFRVAFV